MDAAQAPRKDYRPHILACMACVTGILYLLTTPGGPRELAAQPPAAPTVHPPVAQPRVHAADPRDPARETKADDPFPMPPELIGVELMKQSDATMMAKSAGCIVCHKNTGDPHGKKTLRIGCTDCHGGDATCTDKAKAHVKARYPQFWPTSGNPVRSYTLLNHEDPAFIRFVNPGDLRVAHIGCGTSGCHPKEVYTNRKQIMATGAMLWGAALYNNGSVPFKRALVGEAYSMNGTMMALTTNPAPTEDEIAYKGVQAAMVALPRFEVFQPGNMFRIFEKGGRFKPEVGIPERTEEPGRPRQKLGVRGLGTENRTDPVVVSATKTRLFDPTLNFLGTNDHPGDFRSSGCTACHVVYANDRSPVHSGPYAPFGNRGFTANPDPTIPRNEPGHPIEHRFTSGIPTSQCIVCHIHPGTTVTNTYIGYMWYDEESHAKLIYPPKQKYPKSEEFVGAAMSNPNESSLRNNLSDPAFLNDIIKLNPHLKDTQFADFHSHGWLFKAVIKRDKQGEALDHAGKKLGETTPAQMAAAVNHPCMVQSFIKDQPKNADAKTLKEGEKAFQEKHGGQPVHMLDIHMEKGMHCVDCHFSQDMHGNGRLHMEVRAASEIQCIDCHGTITKQATLRTTGPASYTSAPDNKGRNLLGLRNSYPDGTVKPRFEVQELGNGKKRIFQNSMVDPKLRWEVVQTADVIDPANARYNQKAALAKTVRFENGKMVYGEMPANGEEGCAHQNSNMSCIACHSAWNPSCFGCHLPQKANMKMPQLHAEGSVQRNYVAYNFQTLREDVYMLARDGITTGRRIGPARSSCAIHVGSYNGNRESIYVQQPTVSAEGFSGQAFSTNVPHTVRGSGVGETKQCTDCHVSKANDNNAWMAQLLMQGTNIMNFMGRFCWVAGGEEGLFGVVVTERDEPQAVIGSSLHKAAFPDFFKKHEENGGKLKYAHEHPGKDISTEIGRPFAKSEVLNVQLRGEYLLAACGEGGFTAFDVAFIDDKAFSERITYAPVSPKGQKFNVPTKFAAHVAVGNTPPVDPTRSQMKENLEQKVHPYMGYAYISDPHEGLILVNLATLLDGNPDNNFLKRAVTFNPDGLLNGACFTQIVGHYAYVCCDAGLVVISMENPCEPKVCSVLDHEAVKHPSCVQVQFRYAYVCDAEGIKILDVTNLEQPVAKAVVKLPHAKNVYLGRSYAYVSAGEQGLVILDIVNPLEPKLEMVYNAEGRMNDVHDCKIAVTYNSLFAYIADGKNGMRVLQLSSPDDPGNDGFRVKPRPRLIATYKIPNHGHALNITKALDRDRAVDEAGNQVGVFGRVGARPLNGEEQRKMYLKDGRPWYVTDDPKDEIYILKGKAPEKK